MRTYMRRAFTLVELLVVIGIMAILMAILLPAVSAAHERAKTVKCLSNLHQMFLAASVYTQDNHGTYPAAYWYEPVKGGLRSVNWDFTTSMIAGVRTVETGLLWQGRTDAKIQQC